MNQSIDDDDDFNYPDGDGDGDGDEYSEGEGIDRKQSLAVQNQPHDEEVSLSDSESFSVDPPPQPPRNITSTAAGVSGLSDYEEPQLDTKSAVNDLGPANSQQAAAAVATAAAAAAASTFDSTDTTPGAYNALDYKHLNVSDEVRELFKYIGRYKPHTIDLDTKLKPFIPDYIPAIGATDEFIKVPRPDGKPDYLGLKVLDEPAAKQSDPTVLTLQLRQLSKEAAGGRTELVGRVENNDENRTKKIQQWISSIQDIQKSKPTAAVRYEQAMPELEVLMQEWPADVEAFIRSMKLPTAELDVDLLMYVQIVCGILDIPVHSDPIPSLHLLFSLLLEFKTNPFFRHHLDLTPAFDGSQNSRPQSNMMGTPK